MRCLMRSLQNTRGEFVIRESLAFIILMLLVVFGLTAFGVVNRVSTLHTMTDEAVRFIEERGMVDDTAHAEIRRLQSASGLTCTYEIEADYLAGSSEKVQFGDLVAVRMTHTAYFGVGGIVRVPVTLTSRSEGRSERYWK